MCSKLDYKLLNLCTHQEYIIGSHIYVSKLVGVGLVKQVVTKYRLFNMRKPLSGSKMSSIQVVINIGAKLLTQVVVNIGVKLLTQVVFHTGLTVQ